MSTSVPSYWRNIPVYLSMKGSKCNKCGAKYFPPRKVCVKCGSKDMSEYELPRGGRLIAWSIVRYPPKEFDEFAPYIVGLVELDDGLRVIAQIVDVEVDQLHVGMRLKSTVRRIYEDGSRGIVRYGYKFIPDHLGETETSQ